MRYLKILSIILIGSRIAFAQIPFDIPMIDLPKVTKIDYATDFYGKAKSVDSDNKLTSMSKQSIGVTSSALSSASFNMNIQLIQYRLGIYTDTLEKGSIEYPDGGLKRYFLPFALISKINLDYDSGNAASKTDAASFDGGLLTVRLMPNYSFLVGSENSFTVGFTTDFRTIPFRDNTHKDLQYDYGVYGNVGLKYSGAGDVRDEGGQNYNGTWSLSLLGWIYNGGQAARNMLYEHSTKISGGIESIFQFKVLDTKLSKFNLILSGNYYLNQVSSSENYSLKFAIGN